MSDTLTPKQQYEAKKAARKAREADAGPQSWRTAQRDDENEMTLLFERFVDAAERIATALEARA